MSRVFLLLVSVVLYLQGEEYYFDGENKVLIKPSGASLYSTAEIMFYEDSKGRRVGVNNRLLVQFIKIDKLESYLEEFAAKVEKDLGDGLYLLRLKNRLKTLETANALHQKEDILFAHPDFIRVRELR